MNPHDPFLVTTKEKLRFEQQFNALSPVNGFVTGVQAKDFFLKSGLSPLILGQIWGLADTDADGKMNIIEFSIACKLISSKLRHVEIPKQLPPTLIASLKHIGTPIRTPTGTMSPTEGYKQFLTQQPYTNAQQQIVQPQQIIPQATQVVASSPAPIMLQQQQQQQQQQQYQQQQQIIQNQVMMQPMMSQGIIAPIQQPSMIPQQTALPAMNVIPQQQVMTSIPQQIMPVQPIPQQMMTQAPQQMIVQPIIQQQPQIQPLMTNNTVPAAVIIPQQPPPVPKPPSIEQLTNASLLDSLAQVSAPIATNIPAAPTPTPPQSGHASRSMSFSEKAPSVPDSPSDWAVPQSSKLKYTQMFNAADKSRTGFLTGTQARSILIQTNVPQNSLARIWALSDRDSDGRLGCEEFVLALYLCEMYSTGKQIPTELPNELIPPSFRKVSSRQGSVAGSRHGSVSSQGGAAEIDAMAGMHSQSSFEDKRKENYDKGQAELERRRKALSDMQKKEQEERERKEREEADKREKARVEAEMKKQQEIEREIQRQQELEMEREEQRKRELEKKEQARKDLEKQRQSEWESQKLQEMEQERQKEQDRLLKLKGHNQTLTIELESLSTKVKELSQKICDTRVGVTNVKTVIDGMRSTRDTCVSDQSLYKSKIKEQNARLVQLSQEKARLDAKNKTTNTSADEQAMFTNKQIIIKQLKDKIENIKEEVEEKSNDMKTNSEQKAELRNELQDLITNCEELYNEYDTARIQVLELRNNRKNDNFTSAWDNTTTTTNSWNTTATETTTAAAEPSQHAAVTSSSFDTDASSYVKYKAIYEFSARNSDEITFQPGDIVMVLGNQNAEPGWLAGEINGHTGWFPESYVEKCDDEAETTVVPEIEPEPIEPTIEANDLNNGDVVTEGEVFLSCYPYQSAEVGDLTFEAGEEVRVIKKEGDWWTGVIGARTGIFPANYVQPIIDNNDADVKNNTLTNDLSKMTINGSEQDPITTNSMTAEEADAKNQADADSEVSQINTQNVVNDANMQEFRGMTASASLRAKKGEVAQVIAPYEATSSEQLSLQKGQLVMIRKRSDTGWWEGELQSKGRRRQVGWFPATYVKILAGGKMSGRSTPLSSSKIDLHETVIDKVQAMFPYRALNDDELSFEPDDIISVTSRDEPDWWKGELNGVTGLFPSNYVRAFVSSGKKS